VRTVRRPPAARRGTQRQRPAVPAAAPPRRPGDQRAPRSALADGHADARAGRGRASAESTRRASAPRPARPARGRSTRRRQRGGARRHRRPGATAAGLERRRASSSAPPGSANSRGWPGRRRGRHRHPRRRARRPPTAVSSGEGPRRSCDLPEDADDPAEHPHLAERIASRPRSPAAAARGPPPGRRVLTVASSPTRATTISPSAAESCGTHDDVVAGRIPASFIESPRTRSTYSPLSTACERGDLDVVLDCSPRRGWAGAAAPAR
jgi:hypothetical protein